ncbi:putative transporter [Pseudoclavibacter endophyticus]|uniref:MFS transporter n=1 Tax=Pseudoclavibacter endophyticus TaxID=1778590 RepID=A0A6H9WKV5_9MICO|nr:MFS transporter [Pseudoclavibacter endophyticus]KAB1649446.1 MFS transporter [Pseudoclavibacter endophyticus]GGA62599.1 putative transporter [Pseudoclavibacter endophyticus]
MPERHPDPDGADENAEEAPEASARIPVEIWTLLVATFFMALGFGLVVPVLPQFASSFGVGATLVAIVVSAFAFVRLVSAPLGGVLVNRFGERGTYVAGMLIVAASTYATAFAAEYWQLLVYRGLGGVGSVMFTIASAGILAKYSPPGIRGRVSALWGGMFLVGNISGPIAGGLLGQFGMQLPFFVYGTAMVISALIVAVSAVRNRGTARTDTAPQLPPRTLREVLRDGAFLRLLGSGFANGWVNFGVRAATIPLFVAAAVSSEPWVAGAVIATTAVGNVVSLPWAGRAADRIGRKPLVIWGALIAGVSLVVMIPVQDIASLLVVGFVGGLGAGLMAPANQAMAADIVGHGRSGGQVLSTFQMSQDLGTIVGPIVTGVIIDGLGYGWAFALAGAVMVASGMVWVRGPETLGR